MWSSCCSSSANGARMPRPSTKPSSSTYISTPKPITPNHATGSQYSITRGLLVADRQRARGRLVAFVGVGRRLVRSRARRCTMRNRYQMPAPNTIAYTTAKVISEVHTLPAASVGDTAFAVRSSAVDDPRLAADLHDVPAREHATKPEGNMQFHPRSNQRRIEQAPAPPLPQRGQRQQQHQRADARPSRGTRRTPASPAGDRSRGTAVSGWIFARQRMGEDHAAELAAPRSRSRCVPRVRSAPRTAPAARRPDAIAQCASIAASFTGWCLQHVQPVQVAGEDLQRHRDRGERHRQPQHPLGFLHVHAAPQVPRRRRRRSRSTS